MVDGCRGHRFEALLPVGPGFTRGPEDQVQTDVLETGLPGPTCRINAASRGVCPFQDFQDVRHRGLHSQRYPRETGFPKSPEVFRSHGLRVGLGGDLGVADQAETLPDGIQEPRQLPRRKHGRGAAADEDRVHLGCPTAEHPGREVDLPQRRREIVARGHAPQLGCGVGVEVAVPAAAVAEGDVQVDGERPFRQLGQRGTGQGPVERHRVSGRQLIGHRENIQCSNSLSCTKTGAFGERLWA